MNTTTAARQTMMQLAAEANDLLAAIKAARGNKRAALVAEHTALLPELRTAQRAYLAEQRASKQVA